MTRGVRWGRHAPPRLGLALLLAPALGGCGAEEEPPPAPVASPPATTDGGTASAAPFLFVDVAEAAGIGAFVQENGDDKKLLISESVGGGVAFLDYDGDGDLDLYLSNGSRHGGFPVGEEPTDALFANLGDGTFVDRTAEAGLGDTNWTMGVRVVDFDGDRRPDLYLTNHGPNVLYHNRGDGTFEDVTESAGVGDPGWSTGACFLDYDRDGDLDLYVANYVEFDADAIVAEGKFEEYRGERVYYGPRGLDGARDRFYENQGDRTFRDVSAAVGVDGPRSYGFQALAFDYDEDGWLDIYVANDSMANALWRNDGEGHFEDVAMRAGLALSLDGGPQAGMGIALGDYDGDLAFDLYVTNFAEDYFTLYHGEGEGFFTDVTQRAGLSGPTFSSLGWGCGFEDFDSDGDQDLFAICGHVFPQVDLFPFATAYCQRNLLFENDGGRFREVGASSGPGFALEQVSRGAAVGDFDEDGDLDLLVGNIDGMPALLRNDTPPRGNWVKVLLVGAGANTDAIGARIVGTYAGGKVHRLAGANCGFLSSNDPRLHLGLGQTERIDKLQVLWPDGTEETVRDLPAGHLVVIEQGQGIVSNELLGAR